jgi:hypothetical protein
MKTQWINIDQVLPGINNLIITGIVGFDWHKVLFIFKVSTNKIGDYLLPLIKQLVRDNFMGSEMDMGILLLFIKTYFLLAAYAIMHNALTDQFKKLRKIIAPNAVLHYKDFYQHKQAV